MSVSELRRDPVTGRWVVVSTERPRADDFDRQPVVIQPDDSCPFCAGHEHMTPFEVLAYRNGSPSNQPGWDLRVVPNQSPIVRVEGDLDRQGEGLFDKMNGIGAHEVIIESPRHEDTLATQPEAGVERLLRAFQERIRDLRRDMRFKSFVPFKNHGAAAGAHLEHSHSQLFALPIVPREVRDELEGARVHYAAKERCLFCDIVRQELAEGRRVVAENGEAVALAPVRLAVAVRDLDSAAPPPEPVRGRAWWGSGRRRAAASGRAEADGRRARAAALLVRDPQRAGVGAGGLLPLAHRNPAQGDAVRRVRVGHRLPPQPDAAGDRRQGPARSERERGVAWPGVDVAAGL